MGQYLNGLRDNIRDRIELNQVYDVHQAQSMALRAEQFEIKSSAE